MTSVALVEDHATIRRSWERIINAAPGFRCVCACGSAEEALRRLPRIQPDVVLMDIHLPNRSGIECTALLKPRLPNTEILMLTVYEDTPTIFKALQAGASGYLLKRTLPAELLEAITDVRHGGAPMTSEIARQIVESFRAPSPAPVSDSGLSRREEEILALLSQGYANKEIAGQLHISFDTVRSHLKRIYEKLHVRSRTEAVARYLGNDPRHSG